MYTIVKLENPIRHYAWGSSSAIAELQGRPAPAARPEAELWIGDNPRAPSSALVDGQPVDLREWIAGDPDAVLGSTLRKRYGDSLPFLVKLLAAAHPLSIQVHPNAQQATDGYAREQALDVPPSSRKRSYCDPNPKRELLIALTRFRGLCGFRTDAEVEELLELAAGPVARKLLRAPGGGSGSERPPLAAALLYQLLEAEKGLQRAVYREMREFGQRQQRRNPVADCVSLLCRERSDDAMVMAPLLLNPLTLEPGQALAVHPGTVHCYLEGFGVEVMSCSDNVIRGGLTPKYVDLPELKAVAVPRATPPEVVEPSVLSPSERCFRIGAPEFAVTSEELAARNHPVRHANRAPRVLLCVEGRFQVEAGDGSPTLELVPGEAALLPACVREYRLRGRAHLFSVTTDETAPETR